MKHPDSLILYVDDTAQSAAFFQKLFGMTVAEQSPAFSLLVAPEGWALGLWAKHDVKPKIAAGPGGSELVVTLDSDAAVDEALAQAKALGAPVVQAPVALDFGYTFMVQSPDGHFVRGFHPASS